jgi:P4 family phage/plasmid primase-like protien
MSNIKNNFKSTQLIAKQKLDDFLKKYKIVEKGSKVITHTAFGDPWGSFNIPDDKNDEFVGLYCDGLQNRVDLHMIERPKLVGPLLIDIDFHCDATHDKRQYKLDDIKYIISNINNIVRKYYKWEPDMLLAFILEKNQPTRNEDEGVIIDYKDGFHIVYPHLPLLEKMRFLILHELKTIITNTGGFQHIPFTNSYDEIFDMSVIRNNGWIMYGSRKNGAQYYHLTHIYNYIFEETDTYKYKHPELVKILSNRRYDDTEMVPFKDNLDMIELNNKINEVLQLQGIVKAVKKDNDVIEDIEFDTGDEGEDDSENSEDEEDIESMRTEVLNRIKEHNKQKKHNNQVKDIQLAKKLVMIMSKERATKYQDWIKVGWSLHNVDSGLLDTFKTFSKKAGIKYNEKSCEKIWEKARDEGLTIASLRHWAKLDDPERYNEILSESIGALLIEAESGTEWDLANVVHELYRDQYKCTSISHDSWYEFRNHRWIEIDKAYTLSTRLSEEVTSEFAMLNSLYMKRMSKKLKLHSTDTADKMMNKGNNVMKIMGRLKQSGFKKRVIEECKNKFYDPEFEEYLDSNKNLIGFENGVYDLEHSYFRAGCPDDYISLSVGYDYEEFTLDHPYIKGIEDFFSKVQTEKDMRDYILTLLASYLDGSTRNEQFVLWTGSGCHAAGTRILMYDGGLKCVEDVRIGDKLMGDDFTMRKVLHLYRGKDKMYRVKQTKGNDYIVNGDHRLALKFDGDHTLEYNEKKKRYEITWYEDNEYRGIIKRKKYFADKEQAEIFYEANKNNHNLINKDHKIAMTVNAYLELDENIKDVLMGYNALKDYKTHVIKVEYVNIDDYYGFQVSDNQSYLLEDGTVSFNSNGKSKSVELFQLAYGDYCGVVPITLLTRKSGASNQASPELAELRGKRFVVFQEPENTDEIQVGKMKELTGGDWIYARPLFKEPIRYKPQFKLLLTCNELPNIPSRDGGTWRRLRVSPWESEFVDEPKRANQFKKDYDLTEKLEQWSGAFLWYLITIWYPVYKKEGLKEPAKVTYFTNKYKKDSDIFYEFLDSNYVFTKNDNDFEEHNMVYAAMKYWYSDAMNGKCPYKKKQLVEYLTKNNYNSKNGCLYGVKFKEANENKDNKNANALDN